LFSPPPSDDPRATTAAVTIAVAAAAVDMGCTRLGDDGALIGGCPLMGGEAEGRGGMCLCAAAAVMTDGERVI